MKEDKLIENIDSVVNIQSSEGNWDYDPYMHGMLNGMILIQSMVKNERYEPVSAPKGWCYTRWYEKLWMKITGNYGPIAEESSQEN